LLATPSGVGEDYRHPVREEPYDTSPIVGYLVVDKLVEHEAECGNWVKVSALGGIESVAGLSRGSRGAVSFEHF